MPELPFMQFYPRDWLAEPSLRMCSIGARGLWIEMLSLMHLSPRRGYLLAATGSKLTPLQLAHLTGCDAADCSRLLTELESSGCFSSTDDGTIYSRRMVRDESKRQKCSEAGKRGGGNPTFKGHPKGDCKGHAKVTPKVAPNTDARDHNPEEYPPNPPTGGKRDRSPKPMGDSVPIPTELDTPEFRATWADWLADRRARGKPVTAKAAEMQLKSLVPLGPQAARECVLESLRNGWQGIFPERSTNGRKFNGGDGLGQLGRVRAEPGKYAHLDENPRDLSDDDYGHAQTASPAVGAA